MSLTKLLETIASRRDGVSNEADTRNVAVYPILKELGWDQSNPNLVKAEFAVGAEKKHRIDIALLTSDKPRVLVETKSPGVSFAPRFVEQIVGYAQQTIVDIAVLTDGFEWWLYLPMEAVPPTERRFTTLSIIDGSSDDVGRALTRFLGRDNVLSGQAKEEGERALARHRDQRQLNEAIPAVWKKMIMRQDKDLVALYQKRVFDAVQLRPTREQINERLQWMGDQFDWEQLERGPDKDEDASYPAEGRHFVLWSQVKAITSWHEAIREVVLMLNEQHPDKIESILQITGTKASWFALGSRGKRQGKHMRPIPGTKIWYDSRGDRGRIEIRANRVLKHFEYPDVIRLVGD